MVYTKCLQTISIHFKALFCSFNFFVNDRKRQLRCDDPQAAHYPLKSLRPYQRQRFFTVCISHGKKQSRKSTDMIPMIMSKADHINRFETPSFFFNCNLCSLSTVDQQTAPIVTGHKCSQPTLRERHHTTTAKQT